jgi:hypothetical protein
MLVLVLLGCGSVFRDYEVARDLALADPGPAPASWAPDAAVLLSAPLVKDVVAAAAENAGTLKTSLDAGFVTLEPSLTVSRLDVAEGACVRCLSLKVRLDGTLGWNAGFLAGESPLAVEGTIEAEPIVERTDAGWEVRVSPRDVSDLSVELGAVKGGVDPSSALRTWAGAAIVAYLPAFPLAEIGGTDLPLRGVRVIPMGEAVRIDLLTASPVPAAVPTDTAIPAEGFLVELAVPSLLAVARADAFRQGPAVHGVVPEPTALHIGPDGFVLGLRLWHPTAGAWWRDYVVHGEVRLRDGRLELAPTSVEEAGHSHGAALADPLVALVEGALLKAIDGAIETTVPATATERIQGVRTRVTLEQIDAWDGVLRASGDVALRARKRR